MDIALAAKADARTASKASESRASESKASESKAADSQPMFDLIELLFFAYRDFVGDADRMLASIGFGRAHHRVLHFVNRQPGLTIAELLDILRITKQSLSRVLKELLDNDYVEQRAGQTDRRQRLLYPTEHGRQLALDLAGQQSERFQRALAGMPADAHNAAIEFLLAMIDPDEREKVKGIVWRKPDFSRARPRP